mgnify:CR=1 FL=1
MYRKYQKVSEKIVESNPYWDYRIDQYILPNSKVGKYYYVHTPGSTMVIPVLDGKFVMTSQYRYLNRKMSIEFPGGGLKPNYSPRENAFLELKQETGYVAGELIEIGQFNPCNGLTDEICYVFLAKDLEKYNQELDETEEIITILLSKSEIELKIKLGEIWDGMTLASWSLFLSLQEF